MNGPVLLPHLPAAVSAPHERSDALTRTPNHRTCHRFVLFLLLLAVPAMTMFAQTGSATAGATIGPTAPYFTDDVTATVTVAGGGAGPTGSVTGATDGGTPQTVALTNGVARVNLGFFAPGPHSFAFSYGGDANYVATSSQTLSFTVADRAFAPIGGEYSFATGQDNVAAALDSRGNVYLTNPPTNTIFKYDPLGNITTVPTQDLNLPDGVAVDKNDNLFVADLGNARVVEITATGQQSVLPITGLSQPAALAFDPAFTSLYVADLASANIVIYNLGTQTQTSFNPNVGALGGVAVDAAGNVYFSRMGYYDATLGIEFHGDVFRRDTAGNVLELNTGLDNVQGILLDAKGNLFIAAGLGLFSLNPQGHLSQLMFDPVSEGVVRGVLLTHGIAMDSRGTIYYANGNTLRFVPGAAGDAGQVDTYTQATTAGEANSAFGYSGDFRMNYQAPYGVTITNFTPAGTSLPFTGAGINTSGSGPGAAPFLDILFLQHTPSMPGPWSSYGTLTTSDGASHSSFLYGNGRAYQFAVAPGVVTTVSPGVSSVGGIAKDANGVIYVTDPAANQVLMISPTGTTTTVPFTGLNKPTGIAVDASGAVYVLDSGSSRILRVDAMGKQTVAFDLAQQTPLTSLSAFTMDGGTNFYLGGETSNGQAAIYYVDSLGGETLAAGNIPLPAALAVDGTGSLYSVETDSGTLRRFDLGGNGTVLASGLLTPSAVAVDISGTVYVAGGAGSGVTIVHPDGTTTPYPSTALANASALAVDGAASLVVGDSAGKQVFSVDRHEGGGFNYDFGNVPLGSTHSITGSLTNAGDVVSTAYSISPVTAPFALSSGVDACVATGSADVPLAVAQFCNLTLSYSPTILGDQSQRITIVDPTHSAPIATDVTVSGTGVPGLGGPVLGLSPASLTFPSTAQGKSSAAQTLTLTNTGTATANIASVTVGGADASSFMLQNGCGTTLAVSSTCTMSITFTPTAANQSFSGTVSVASDDPLTPALAALAGSSPVAAAANPTATLTPAANFGSVTVGQSAADTLTLINTGAVSLSISSTSVLSSPFTLSGSTCATTLLPGATCTYTVVYTPTSAGTIHSSLSVTDSAGTQTSILTGVGVAAPPPAAPQAALTPATADFTSVVAGSSSKAHTFTLTNAGNAALPVTSVAITGANPTSFALATNNCGASLAAGSSCTLLVTFSPAAAGSFAATLSVLDTVGTQTSMLLGTGTAPPTPPDFTLVATPAAQSSDRGATVTYTVQLASSDPTNAFTSAVQLSASGLPEGATAAFSPGSVVPGTTQPVASSMTVSVSALSARNERSPAPRYPSGALPAGVSMTSLGFLWLLRRKAKVAPRWLVVLLGVGLACAAVSLAGCGGTTTGFAVPQSTSTLTVTGTSGSLTHTTTVTLTVQ